MAQSLKVSEAAAMLSCSGQTVRSLVHAGKLPAFRVGREFRILQTDLEALRVPTSTTTAQAGEGGGVSA